MRPTRGYVKQQALAILDDPSGSRFGDPVFAAGFNEAYDALFNALLNAQCPRLTNIIEFTAPINTTSLTPDQIGISDFADYEYMSERSFGTTEKWIDLNPVDRLTQRQPIDRFMEFCYRNDAFYFIGNTTVRDMQLCYETSGEAPTDDATVINLDGCATFLSNYTVGAIGGRKGYEDTAQRCMMLAVGPAYQNGVIGGELFRIVQPRVRSRQHVQMAPKPYSATRRMMVRRAVPYVAAQQGATGGGSQNVPIQFSSNDGTIVGTIDGTNAVFWLVVGVVQATVYLNGIAMTTPNDYLRLNNQITFIGEQIPKPGDVITAQGWTSGSSPTPSSTPERGPLSLTSGSGTIIGPINGINATFTYAVNVAQQTVFRNGQALTVGEDYTPLSNGFTITTPYQIPQTGDSLSAEVWPA